MQDEPQVVAAEREMLSRAETGLGLAQSRFRLGFAEQDLAISRRRFDEGQRMEREQLAIEGGRSAEDINTRFDRVIRGIDIGTMRRQRDIGISAGRAREDVGRSQARSLREVNIGEAESVEDVNTNFQRGVRDTILGSVLTGMPGALVQLALRRGDALQDVRRNAARGRSRIGRSTGDALTDIGIGERRALDDADTAARDAHGDAALGKSDAIKDLDREQQRRGDDLKKRQEAEARAFDEQEKRQKQMLVLAQAEIDIRQRLNEQLTATTPELIKQIQMITKAFETGSTDIDNARKRIREAQTGMMEGAAT